MNFVDTLKEIFKRDPREIITRGLHAQPLMREYLVAQDAALQTIFSQLEAADSELKASVDAQANQLFVTLENAGKIPSGQEEPYRELSRRNARRIIWEFTPGLKDEVADDYASLWTQEMHGLGVLEEFQEKYVVSGISQFVEILAPDEPYFNE